ncbi:MAG: T9SS type A sorting domain-containing protein [Saprospiraceae bacterium]|nr:T9SS type A sorting domain-containing protein [Saprospiraceae bacterium]
MLFFKGALRATFFAFAIQFSAFNLLLTNGNNYTNIVGLAYQSPTSINESYGVVKSGDALGRSYSFTHEFGHLVHGRHDADLMEPPGQGFKLNLGGSTRSIITLMYRLTTSLNPFRILNFSNPDVNYNKSPTGVSDANNACLIQGKACETSAFLPSEPCTFLMTILPETNCNTRNFFLSVTPISDNDPNCEPTDFIYTFKYSTDGIFFYELCNFTQDNFCELDLPAPGLCGTIFFKVEIFERTTFLPVSTVFNWFTTNCLCGNQTGTTGGNGNLFKKDGNIPIEIEEINSTIDQNEDKNNLNFSSIEIYDICGKLVYRNENFKNFTINEILSSNYLKGLFFVKIGNKKELINTFRIFKP